MLRGCDMFQITHKFKNSYQFWYLDKRHTTYIGERMFSSETSWRTRSPFVEYGRQIVHGIAGVKQLRTGRLVIFNRCGQAMFKNLLLALRCCYLKRTFSKNCKICLAKNSIWLSYLFLRKFNTTKPLKVSFHSNERTKQCSIQILFTFLRRSIPTFF